MNCGGKIYIHQFYNFFTIHKNTVSVQKNTTLFYTTNSGRVSGTLRNLPDTSTRRAHTPQCPRYRRVTTVPVLMAPGPPHNRVPGPVPPPRTQPAEKTDDHDAAPDFQKKTVELITRSNSQKKFPSLTQSNPDFETAIAITIAIENHSGKIGNRFSSHNRIPIFM